MQSTKLAAALNAAAKGFRVFPIEPNTKRPKYGLPWKEKATSDPARIQSWWDENPDFNIGVALGRGMFVVDADTKDGRPGLASLDLLDMMGLPTSLRVSTPSSGIHVYLKSDRPHRNRVDSIAEYPGIDIRAVDDHGRTGYVVGPGSVVDGKEYRVVSSAGIGTCPPWFDEILAAAPARRMEHTSQPLVDLDLPENIERANNWLANSAPEAIEGAGGDDTTFRVACRLRDFGLSKETALESLLEHWNETKASPPWQPDELEAKVENAFEYASGGWGAGTAAGEFSGLEIEGIEPPKGVRNEHTPNIGIPISDVIPTISAASFDGQETPVRKWRVPDLIPDENVTIINGDGATGKSLLAMQLSVAAVAIRSWLGEAVTPGPVLYFSAEDDAAETHIRLKEICRAEGIPLGTLADLHIAVMAGENCILATEGGNGSVLARTKLFRSLENTMAQIRPVFLVLDNLADIYGANENVRELARQFIGMLRKLAIKYQCAVVLLAHPSLSGMASGSGSSGNTAWNNSPRARLYLQRDKDTNGEEADPNLRILEVKKANYTAMGRKIEIRWDAGRFVSTAPDFADLDAADAPQETPIEKAERVFLKLVEKFNGMNRNIAATKGVNYAPKVFAKHNAAERVPERHLEMAMENLFEKKAIAVETTGYASKQRRNIVIARETSTPLPPPSTSSKGEE